MIQVFHTEGNSILRTMIGLSVHHLHYGFIFILIAALIFIFYKINKLAVALMGLGLGLVLDEFIPSLLLMTIRSEEIVAYKQGFIWTIILFSSIILISILLYFRNKNRK